MSRHDLDSLVRNIQQNDYRDTAETGRRLRLAGDIVAFQKDMFALMARAHLILNGAIESLLAAGEGPQAVAALAKVNARRRFMHDIACFGAWFENAVGETPLDTHLIAARARLQRFNQEIHDV